MKIRRSRSRAAGDSRPLVAARNARTDERWPGIRSCICGRQVAGDRGRLENVDGPDNLRAGISVSCYEGFAVQFWRCWGTIWRTRSDHQSSWQHSRRRERAEKDCGQQRRFQCNRHQKRFPTLPNRTNERCRIAIHQTPCKHSWIAHKHTPKCWFLAAGKLSKGTAHRTTWVALLCPELARSLLFRHPTGWLSSRVAQVVFAAVQPTSGTQRQSRPRLRRLVSFCKLLSLNDLSSVAFPCIAW